MMWLVGMPTPVLWGVLAMLFNFIPYVRAIAAAALVFMAALSTFDSLARPALTAFVFWLCTAAEGQFVTPTILGKTLKVGPVVVLIAVAVWGFLWGLPGVFIAVPLLMVQRHVFAQFESTYPLAVILGESQSRRSSLIRCLRKMSRSKRPRFRSKHSGTASACRDSSARVVSSALFLVRLFTHRRTDHSYHRNKS